MLYIFILYIIYYSFKTKDLQLFLSSIPKPFFDNVITFNVFMQRRKTMQQEQLESL